ncbi:dephospho-CoA kinase [archaeon SCG-AAA382B04]|nr:dephospho-CoA kinase [archaeon SCG-AAA382B04]
MKKIIGFIGKQASGKTTAANSLSEDVPVVVMGDCVRKETRNRGYPLTEKNIGKVANELREKNGMDAIAQLAIPEIKEKDSEVVAIDGIRGKAEIDAYREEFGEKFVSIAILATKKTRFDRTKQRERSDDATTWDSFIEKDKREENWGLDEAIREADHQIKNETNLSDFKKKVNDLVSEIDG